MNSKFNFLGLLLMFAGVAAQSPRTLKVTTILDSPFVIEDEDGEYKGFIIDVLNAILKSLAEKGKQFNAPDIQVVKDGRYGARLENGSFNGMVGELIQKEADLSAAALTVTTERDKVIDFSTPFSSSGLTLMMNREDVFGEDRSAYNLGYFLNPFSVGVWLILLLCFLLVSLTIAVLNRFDPFEYGARKEEGNLPQGVSGNLGLRESLLFCFSTLTLQGYQRPPLSLAVRVMSCFWFFFSIIVVATYVANLVQITQEANVVRNPKFTSLDDVIDSDVSLGALYQGSTYALFRSSDEEPFYSAWKRMNTHRENFPDSTKHGVDKVAEGGYAYVAEIPYADFIVSRNCSIVMVGRPIASSNYAFGFPKDSDLVADFNEVLMDLSRKGILEKLHDRWWHSEHKCPWSKVTDDMVDPRLESGRGPVVPLSLTQFVGPILILVIGFFLSLIVFIVEVLYYSMTVGDENERRKQTREAKI